MFGFRVRWVPAGRAVCDTPLDMTPVVEVIEANRGQTFVIAPRSTYLVTDDELEAARSLLAALTVFVADCERWAMPTTPAKSPPAGGAA